MSSSTKSALSVNWDGTSNTLYFNVELTGKAHENVDAQSSTP